jgi:23S rRNA pseudouridine2605 synthase
VLAAAGLGSRRACEELITAGRVEVDRAVVSELGARVDSRSQEIRVDGERLPDTKRVVYLLHKPVGAVTTNFDPAGRPRVVDLVPGERRLFAVGRLDRMSEGLILVTNDGELANLLAHPRYGVEKKYLVQVAGVPAPELLDKIRQGVRLAEGEVHAKRVSIRSQHKQSAVLEMVLDEGKNREIRRMLARLGHKVHQLKRVAVGGLTLGNLLPGQWRQLAWSEVETLRREALAAVGSEPLRPPVVERGRGPRRGAGGPGRTPAGRDRGTGESGYRPGGQGRGTAGPGRGVAGQGRRSGGPGKAGGGQGRRPGGPGQRDRDGAQGGSGGRPPVAPRRRKRAGKASTWRAAKKRPGGGGAG